MQTGRAFSALYAARSIVSCAAGRGPWRVGAESEGCALRHAEYHFLRGGTMVLRHADRESGFSALRLAVCSVVTGPAGRCGYFSFSAYRRRQRKVPRKEARHSYLFEGGSLQLDKSCRKEAGTAAFLSASQTPKGKKSRPKERPWLPQARRRSENGGGPARAAERRAGRSGQRSLRGVNFATARSARSGHGTRGRPSGQQTDKTPPHSTASTNPTPKIHPQNLSHAAKRSFSHPTPD